LRFGNDRVSQLVKSDWLEENGSANHAAILRSIHGRKSGKVVAWGSNECGQCNIPEDIGEVVQIACGYAFCVSLDKFGKLRAWGRNNRGQCDVPEHLPEIDRIFCYWEHVIAIDVNGKGWTWGNNDEGQCDLPHESWNLFSISCGIQESLLLNETGELKVLGKNKDKFGHIPETAPRIVQISHNHWGTVHGLDENGKVWAWGNNDYNRCFIPNDLPELAQIHRTSSYSIALSVQGKVIIWGYGQKGLYHHAINPSPHDPVGIQIASNSGESFAIDSTGQVWQSDCKTIAMCWKKVENINSALMVSAGSHHYAAIIA
jgi:alpha-tubulin suppressor-like RCC1 family protein